jgi:hypothetical protein
MSFCVIVRVRKNELVSGHVCFNLIMILMHAGFVGPVVFKSRNVMREYRQILCLIIEFETEIQRLYVPFKLRVEASGFVPCSLCFIKAISPSACLRLL